MLRSRTWSLLTSSPPNRIRPASEDSSPAIILSKVVLPEPDGPSRAVSLPSGMSSDTSFRAWNLPKDLLMRSIVMLISCTSCFRRRVFISGLSPFHNGLGDQCQYGDSGQQRGRGKRAGHVVILIKQFNMQR